MYYIGDDRESPLQRAALAVEIARLVPGFADARYPEWEALLTPAVHRVKIWVRPVKDPGGTFSWHAYTVIAYQFVR